MSLLGSWSNPYHHLTESDPSYCLSCGLSPSFLQVDYRDLGFDVCVYLSVYVSWGSWLIKLRVITPHYHAGDYMVARADERAHNGSTVGISLVNLKVWQDYDIADSV